MLNVRIIAIPSFLFVLPTIIILKSDDSQPSYAVHRLLFWGNVLAPVVHGFVKSFFSVRRSGTCTQSSLKAQTSRRLLPLSNGD